MIVYITSLGIDLISVKDNLTFSTRLNSITDFRSPLEILSVVNDLGHKIVIQRNQESVI
jgi:hypothetical protein